MIYYTIYKVTNKINGKVYIGSHKTKDLNDNYMGSGKYLKYAQEKHGIENFTREIMYVFDTPEQMYVKEAELVNEEFIAESNTYNLKVGGFGGWDYINNNEILRVAKNKKAREIANAKGAHIKGSKKVKELYPRGTFYGKTHSDATKRSLSNIMQGNPKCAHFKGFMWITNGKENTRIKNTCDIPPGWYKGRTVAKK